AARSGREPALARAMADVGELLPEVLQRNAHGVQDYRPAGRFSNRLFVAGAAQDREARIADEARVFLGARAAPEPALARGLLHARPATARAEPDVGIEIARLIGHGRARRIPCARR